jgi:hypothetical protein
VGLGKRRLVSLWSYPHDEIVLVLLRQAGKRTQLRSHALGQALVIWHTTLLAPNEFGV